LIAADDVADADDIDRAWKAAMGLGRGPIETLREIGSDRFAVVSHEQVAAGLISDADAERARAHAGKL
jgi:3-hydroxyacyl-CoA dehydrogenase